MSFVIGVMLAGELGLGIWLAGLWIRLNELATHRAISRIDQAATDVANTIKGRRVHAEDLLGRAGERGR